MKNLTLEKNTNKIELKDISNNNQEKLTISDIEKFYTSKEKNNFLFGIEYERVSFNIKNKTAAKYDEMSKIIKNFASILKWELLFDDDTIIGARDVLGNSISLEPGCQIELSLIPYENVIDIQSQAEKILDVLDKVAAAYNIVFLGYGINPVDAAEEINIFDKKRYKIMNEYLPYCNNGELCPVMMRKTAGIQINIDYRNKKDAYEKLLFFNLIMPFMTALSSNSPFDNNSLTNNKSNRAYAWLYTGKARCNCFYKGIFKHWFKRYENIFKDYIKEIINVPMVYIVRNGANVPIKGKMTFEEFMKTGYSGYFAEMKDYILHQSLCFPDVRLKQYIEIRNHDSSNFNTALALCAFYKGLSIDNVSSLLKQFSFLKINDVDIYNKKMIKEGLDFKVNNRLCGWDVVAKLFNIARNNLNSKERAYLRPIFDILVSRKTKADIIIDYDIKNVDDLIEFLN